MTPNEQDFTHHISGSFNQDLEELRTQFLQMGTLVEQQVDRAIEALLDTDAQLASEVQKNDADVNALETKLDNSITKILALRQPAASDLRMVMAMSKAITDLERIGDEAAKIARIAKNLAEEGESPRGYTEVRHIASLVSSMLNEALESFMHLDAELAFEVMKADADVDREYQSAVRTLITYTMEDPRYISRIINVLWVLRSLERIGDHTRNVAEQVIYIVKGHDIRHTDYEVIEQHIK